MKDKLGRLAKGMTEIETPVIEISPESFSDTLQAGREYPFMADLLSTNGIGIKGVCFADEPRIRTERNTFVGRRVAVSFRINTEGMKDGELLKGEVILLTNGGEFSIPYEFGIGETPESAAGTKDRASEAFSENVRENPLTVRHLPRFEDTPEEEDSEELHVLESFLPEDEPLFEGVLGALIRSGNTSGYAFRMYREAIRRGLDVTRLYESYVHAFPEDCEECMPKEVFLYFSYEHDADHGILRKLYKNILLHVDKNSEIYNEYESAISEYAVSCAFDRIIDQDLALLYDRMIDPGMIDEKAAEILPDIFKCRRIRLTSGEADYLIVRYPEMKNGIRAELRNGETFVPVYFKNADIRFFLNGSAKDQTSSVSYESDEVFHRPEIIRRCFELVPGHRMLLLSAAKEISARGIAGENEKAILVRAMRELDLSRDFRDRLIWILSESGGDSGWIGELKREDYSSEAGGRLFSLFVREGRWSQAYELLWICGIENVELCDMARLVSEIISGGDAPAGDSPAGILFVKLCKYLYEHGQADEQILSLLAREYEGSIGEMLRVLRSAEEAGCETADLPEKLVSCMLFTGETEHLDEAFSPYIRSGRYSDLIVRAYFTVRSTDSFLNERDETGSIFSEALVSYARAVQDPLSLPLIYQLALTRLYSEMDGLDEADLEICQKLTDDLIRQGLIFCYTKKLRKKIRIPEEICRRFYVEYHASTDAAPRMLARITPDEEEYHEVDMQRVYKNIYVMSIILFKGDELQYVIYDSASAKEASEEGIISVRKFHRQSDAMFESLNSMTRAIDEKDVETLKENMLGYVENAEMLKELFKLES
ncbi:MAG: hypothetical protein IJ061_00660 [Lachnospiraceae bacterium]|nr:hypothetical protein [Lachnospiraceae bacterium]